MEVIVVADGQDAVRKVAKVCRHMKARLFETGPSAIGHPQRNFGMARAHTEWLAFMDDDDVYTPEAFAAFKRHEHSELPVLFKMRLDDGVELWKTQDVSEGNVGTPMILCRKDKAGTWPHQRCGDYHFIHETVTLNGGVVWDETVVCQVGRNRD